jgi:hypothetical protein
MARKRRNDWLMQMVPKELYADNGPQFQSSQRERPAEGDSTSLATDRAEQDAAGAAGGVVERSLTLMNTDISTLPGYTRRSTGSSTSQSDENDS